MPLPGLSAYVKALQERLAISSMSERGRGLPEQVPHHPLSQRSVPAQPARAQLQAEHQQVPHHPQGQRSVPAQPPQTQSVQPLHQQAPQSVQPLRQQAPQSVQPLHQQATIQSRGLPARRSVLALPVDSASQESGDDDDRSDGCPSDFNLSDDDYQSDGCPSDFNGSDDDITAQWRRAFFAFQRLVREPGANFWSFFTLRWRKKKEISHSNLLQ
jgi:hypothetical protein